MNKNHFDKLKWYSISVYYSKMEELLVNVVNPFLSKNKDSINRFWFNRSSERGNNLILMFQMRSDDACKGKLNELKESFEKYLKQETVQKSTPVFHTIDWFLPYPKNHIEFNNNFLFDIIETGGLKASKTAEILFEKSSLLALQLFSNENDERWNPEDELARVFQFQLALSSSVFNINEQAVFYSTIFNKIIDRLNFDKEELIKLKRGLEDNYKNQEEMIIGYLSFLLSNFHQDAQFDDDLLNDWKKSCELAINELKTLQYNNEFFAPEDFEENKKLNIPLATQELMPIIEYYTRSLNSQFGVKDSIELNVIYVLNKALHAIINN